jgi:hypothetical protein
MTQSRTCTVTSGGVCRDAVTCVHVNAAMQGCMLHLACIMLHRRISDLSMLPYVVSRFKVCVDPAQYVPARNP